MIYVQSMDLNKLGQMLGLFNENFLVEDAIFLTEKAKDFLRSRSGFHGTPMLNLILRCWGERHLLFKDFMALPIRDYCVGIVFCNNGIEGSWLFYGKDSDDSRMWCLKGTLGKSIFGTKNVYLTERGSEEYEFINTVSGEIREIHTNLINATSWP